MSERLDKIIARNTRPPWYKNTVVRAVALGIFVIVSIALSLCSDLGKPPVKPKPKATHIENVKLGR